MKTEQEMVIPFESAKDMDRCLMKFDSVKVLHHRVARQVLGHDINDADWIVFDDMLTMEYDRLTALLKVLDEKAG